MVSIFSTASAASAALPHLGGLLDPTDTFVGKVVMELLVLVLVSIKVDVPSGFLRSDILSVFKGSILLAWY
jgi:hypothetical protein